MRLKRRRLSDPRVVSLTKKEYVAPACLSFHNSLV